MDRATLGSITNAYATPPTIAGASFSPLKQQFDQIFGNTKANIDNYLATYDGQPRHIMSLPELMVGRDKTTLGTRFFMKLRIAAEDTFYFEIAPIEETDKLGVEWDTVTFENFQPTPTPEMGRVRITDWSFDHNSEQLQRLGMGAEFPYGFFLDEKGQKLAQGCYDALNQGAIEGMSTY
jgi:hypothetical protein